MNFPLMNCKVNSLLIHEQKLNQQDNKEQALRVLYSNNRFSISQRGGQ